MASPAPSLSAKLKGISPFVPLPHRRLRPRSLRVHAKIREIFMPALSSTMTKGKIVSWVKSEGDLLSKGESVVVVESDMDVETFYDGILAAIFVPEGDSAPIGILAETDVSEVKAKAAACASPPAPSPPPAVSQSGRTVATAHAKKLAKQHKMDIGKVAGTGPCGRITAADVESARGSLLLRPVLLFLLRLLLFLLRLLLFLLQLRLLRSLCCRVLLWSPSPQCNPPCRRTWWIASPFPHSGSGTLSQRTPSMHSMRR